jgi:hypothetical protein
MVNGRCRCKEAGGFHAHAAAKKNGKIRQRDPAIGDRVPRNDGDDPENLAQGRMTVSDLTVNSIAYRCFKGPVYQPASSLAHEGHHRRAGSLRTLVFSRILRYQ